MDLTCPIDAGQREIHNTTRDGAPARMVVAQRAYLAPPDDVWDALTNRERITRWLLPITGELRLGGKYQLEGNAGGTINVCDPPRHLAVTWEYDGGVTWVDVHLEASEDGTACASSTSLSSTTSTNGASSVPAPSVSDGT